MALRAAKVPTLIASQIVRHTMLTHVCLSVAHERISMAQDSVQVRAYHDVGDGVVGRQADGVHDEAVLVPLHLPNAVTGVAVTIKFGTEKAFGQHFKRCDRAWQLASMTKPFLEHCKYSYSHGTYKVVAVAAVIFIGDIFLNYTCIDTIHCRSPA
jgi:hypothetical protein